jgi:glycosyltransferase involved in cell wall biosynthesis
MQPIVSIIMPAKDVEPYIRQAIDSVVNQTYSNWELLIIENGSNDKTLEVIRSFNDKRIIVFISEETGLSRARNIGLSASKGEFICFLDSDDRLPANSIASRIRFMNEHPEVFFCDGRVATFDCSFNHIIRQWNPDFRGNPKKEMARINPGCFSAITWLIRKPINFSLQFNTAWTHLEDRMFFLSISHLGRYDFIDEEVYHIRRRPGSLMSNDLALESAFLKYLNYVHSSSLLSADELKIQKKKFHQIFFKTYIKHGKIRKSLLHLIHAYFG